MADSLDVYYIDEHIKNQIDISLMAAYACEEAKAKLHQPKMEE